MNRQLLGKLSMSITTVLLCKETAMESVEVSNHYLEPLAKEGIATGSILVLPLLYNTPTKIMAKTAKAYLDKLINKIPNTANKLIIADSSFYKFITKIAKVSDKYGTVVGGKHPGYLHFTCVYVPNYKTLFQQPENAQLITLGIKAIAGTGTAVLISSSAYG